MKKKTFSELITTGWVLFVVVELPSYSNFLNRFKEEAKLEILKSLRMSEKAPPPSREKSGVFLQTCMSQDEAFVHSMFVLSKEDPEFVYRDPIDYLKLRYSMLKDREDKKHSRMYLTARKRVLKERFDEYVKQVEDEKVQHMATQALQRALLAEQNVREERPRRENGKGKTERQSDTSKELDTDA